MKELIEWGIGEPNVAGIVGFLGILIALTPKAKKTVRIVGVIMFVIAAVMAYQESLTIY